MLPRPRDFPDDAPRFADGRYVLLATLGSGGMASVYAAWDTVDEAWRALKVLLPMHAASRSLSERFEQEARLMMSLSSPHLVKTFEVGRQDDLPYLVMEVVGAGSLHQWQEQHGPMPARLAVEVGQQLCRALTVVHEADIVHRDVKPRNVLIDTTGTIKLTDFGIARTFESGVTRTGLAMGTLGFMSPEQVHDAKSVDARTDLYALGATLWTMLTAKKAQDLFRFADKPELVEGIPPSLQDVLHGCLAYERHDRFGSAEEAEYALASTWLSLPPLPPGTPPLPLHVEPLAITTHPADDFADIFDHVSPIGASPTRIRVAPSAPVELVATPATAELRERLGPSTPSTPPRPSRGEVTHIRPAPAATEPAPSAPPDPDIDPDAPGADNDELPDYLMGVEQSDDGPRPELVTGRDPTDPEPAHATRRPLDPARLALGIVAAVVALWLFVGGSVVLAGSSITASDRRLDELGAELGDRAAAAAPLVDELRRLGGDPYAVDEALRALDPTGDPRARAADALVFLAEAERVAAEVATSDDHDARLVRQRLDRLRSAHAAFARAWGECEATSRGMTGRWALALGLAEPACEPEGER